MSIYLTPNPCRPLRSHPGTLCRPARHLWPTTGPRPCCPALCAAHLWARSGERGTTWPHPVLPTVQRLAHPTGPLPARRPAGQKRACLGPACLSAGASRVSLSPVCRLNGPPALELGRLILGAPLSLPDGHAVGSPCGAFHTGQHFVAHFPTAPKPVITGSQGAPHPRPPVRRQGSGGHGDKLCVPGKGRGTPSGADSEVTLTARQQGLGYSQGTAQKSALLG